MMRASRVLVLVACLVVGAALPAAARRTTCRCRKEVRTVCAGGKEYGNRCLARCAGLEVFTDGPCRYNSGTTASAGGAPKRQSPCACQLDWRPVCASPDGGKSFRTFENECGAKCAGAAVKAQGECYSETMRDDDLDGVADAPRPGAPAAKRGDAPEETPGQVGSVLPSICPCPAASDGPVCGAVSADGRLQQFASSCLARCKGARDVTNGPCPNAAGAPAPAPAAGAPAAGAAPAGGAAAIADGACNCPRAYRRVCGKDGQTYNNDCLAKCAGTAAASEGQCSGPECSCPLLYTPVCGADGNTWGNDCAAKCSGVKVRFEGECGNPGVNFAKDGAKPGTGLAAQGVDERLRGKAAPAPAAPPPTCRCSREFEPLCGLDGKTYANTCLAKCAGAAQAYPGACIDACKACPSALQPYCGVSKTFGARSYANCCFAKCSGLDARSDVIFSDVCKMDGCATRCLKKAPRAPVCCGGKTYASECLAQCKGAGACVPGTCATAANAVAGTTCTL
ncbi:MAG: hypothetical protein J3K34DRAFT_286570 [Monoraphidium minutum]|nr:MAG: hypothetical protein J3K34DRAFT_286570 [Monoraphidium minutum]